MQEALEAKEHEVKQLTEGQREVSDRASPEPQFLRSHPSPEGLLGWLGSHMRAALWERGVLLPFLNLAQVVRWEHWNTSQKV